MPAAAGIYAVTGKSGVSHFSARPLLRYRTAADGRYRACGRCAAGESSDVPSDRAGHDADRFPK